MDVKYILSFVVLLTCITTAYGQIGKAERITLSGSNLNNFYRIDAGVYRSEQPEAEDFKAMGQYGIKEVLNLRRWHSDDKKAKGTSLILHRLKTNAHSISEKEITEALRIIKDRKGPIVIHCKHGSDRTGGVVALYRIIFQNVSKEDAIAEMRDGGFGFHSIYRNIVNTVMSADIEKMRRELGL